MKNLVLVKIWKQVITIISFYEFEPKFKEVSENFGYFVNTH